MLLNPFPVLLMIQIFSLGHEEFFDFTNLLFDNEHNQVIIMQLHTSDYLR